MKSNTVCNDCGMIFSQGELKITKEGNWGCPNCKSTRVGPIPKTFGSDKKPPYKHDEVNVKYLEGGGH